MQLEGAVLQSAHPHVRRIVSATTPFRKPRRMAALLVWTTVGSPRYFDLSLPRLRLRTPRRAELLCAASSRKFAKPLRTVAFPTTSLLRPQPCWAAH